MAQHITFEWLGTAGFRFTHDGHVTLLDPYLTRVHDRVTPIVSNPEHLRRYISSADTIVVSHSHFDHFADVPAIAKMTGATIVGSETTLNYSRSYGISERQLALAQPRVPVPCTGLEVTFIPSRHGLNDREEVPNPGFQSSVGAYPEISSDFKEGGTFAPYFKVNATHILHIGSANYIDKEIYGLAPDVLLLCIAWRERVPHFLERLFECVKPKVIIPSHWDDYFVPIERGLVPRRDTSIEQFHEEVKKLRREVRVVQLGLFEPWSF